MRARLLVVAVCALWAGCQLVLPDISLLDEDAGPDADADSDSDSDTDSDADGDTDPGQNGAQCDGDEECLSAHCQNGICCDAGEICCASDDVCPDDLACDTALFSCFEECGPAGDEHDERCAEGYHCDANSCLADVELGPCDEHSDCASGECVGDLCCEHAGLCCAADEDCPDLFDGCATDDTQTCVFSFHAIPDSGQAGECYNVSGSQVGCETIIETNDYYGQDGHYPGEVREYTDNEDGTVTDLATGLSWTRAPGDPDIWSSCKNYCESLSTGSGNWRLPDRIELQMLLDHGSGGSVGIDAEFEVPVGAEQFWTGTELAGSESTTAWVVDLADGTVLRLGKDNPTPRVLCVEDQ